MIYLFRVREKKSLKRKFKSTCKFIFHKVGEIALKELYNCMFLVIYKYIKH